MRKLRNGAAVGMATALLVTLGGPPPARAHGPVETALATTADLLDLATYRVRTVVRRPDGTETERTTAATVGVPALVNVDGGLPDLSVSVLPVADRVRLQIDKLPTAAATLPVLVEAVFDLPATDGGPPPGAAFGYDQRTSTAPRSLRADVRLPLLALQRNAFTMDVAPSGAPGSLTLIGSVFGRSGSARLDPKSGSLELRPVPAHATFTAELTSRETHHAAPQPPASPGATCDPMADGPATTPVASCDRARVSVGTSERVRAIVTATDQRGDFRRDVTSDIQDLPTNVTVTYTDETLERAEPRLRRNQIVDYRADAEIRQLDVDVAEHVGEVEQRTVDATVEGLPRSFTTVLKTDDGLDGEVPVQHRRVEHTAGDGIDELRLTADELVDGDEPQQVHARLGGLPAAFTLDDVLRGTDDPATDEDERTHRIDFDAPAGALGSLEAGVATGRPVQLLQDPRGFFEAGDLEDGEEPAYAFADGDDIAVRLFGISEALVDIADPLTVHAVATPGPLLVHRLDPGRTITANVLDLPRDTTVTYSPTTQRTTFTGPAATIDEVRAVVDSTTPLLGRATHAELRAEDVPTGLELTVDPGPEEGEERPDGEPVTLVSFDAHGSQVGLLEASLTDGAAVEGLPEGADGVVLRDLPDRFTLFGRITGLRGASVVQEDTLGNPAAVRIQRFDTELELDAPVPEGEERELVVDVGSRAAGGKLQRLLLDLDDRPNRVDRLRLNRTRVALPVINPELISFPRGQRLNYEADRRAGDLVACVRTGATLPEVDCENALTDPAIRGQVGLSARVEPIPAKLDVCLDNDAEDFGREGVLPKVGCFGELPEQIDQTALCDELKLDCRDGGLLVKTSAEFEASEPVRIDLFDCRQVVTFPGQPTPVCIDSFSVSDLLIEELRAQLDSPTGTGDLGYAFLDTDDKPVTGRVRINPDLEESGDTEVRVDLPVPENPEHAFEGQDRFVVFEAQITGADGSIDVFDKPTQGTCQRPRGTDIEVRTVILGVGTPAFELANDLCPLAG